MSAITYTNRFGDVYYLRKTASGRGQGTQIVCSKKHTADALEELPDGMEIAESPNGKVSCRVKLESTIPAADVNRLNSLAKQLASHAFVAVELKKDSMVVHSASKERLKALACLLGASPAELGLQMQKGSKPLPVDFERLVRNYQPALLFSLVEPETKTYSVLRKCYMDSIRGEWLPLATGELTKLAKKYLPHLEQESFFELF